MRKRFFSAFFVFTLIATPVFAADEYTVKYACDKIFGGTPPSSTTVAYGDDFVPEENTCTVPTGYRFKNWKVSGTKYIMLPDETYTTQLNL